MTLPVGDYVNDYGSDDEARVLETVRKYPSHSVDKLVELLPGIKRNKIQIILEKNNLSRLGQRLEFSNYEGVNPRSLEALTGKIGDPLKKVNTKAIKNSSYLLLGSLKAKLSLKTAIVGTTIVFLLLILNLFKSLLIADTPIVYLNEPRNKEVIRGDSVFISGSVEPANAAVTINGKKAALNGNGEFTAVTHLDIGENIIEVIANNKFKKANLLTVVTRELSAEENRTQAKQEEQIEEVAEIEQEISDILAVQDTNSSGSSVEITENTLIETGEYTLAAGEVTNFGGVNATSIQVIATFFGENGEVLDVAEATAVDSGNILRPGENAPFETVPTTVEYNNYELTVDWEEANP